MAVTEIVYFITFGYFNEDGTEDIIVGMTTNFPQRWESYCRQKAFNTDRATLPFVVECDKARDLETHLLRTFKTERYPCSRKKSEWLKVRMDDVRKAVDEYCAEASNAKAVAYENEAPYDETSRVRVGPPRKAAAHLVWRRQKISQLVEASDGALTVGQLLNSFKHYRTNAVFQANDIADVETSPAAKSYTESDLRYDILTRRVLVY